MIQRRYGYYYSLPVFFWSIIFFLSPLLIIFLYSFLERGLYGGVVYRFTLQAYYSLINPSLIKVFLTTFWMSAVATLLMILLAIPSAYFIVRSRYKNFWLLLVIIPFWTNFLIRIYAWIAILGNNGFLNQILSFLHITTTYIQFLYNPYAVILVMVYTYLPFAIFPLYANMEKFDFALLEAACDLGATKMQSILKVLIPNIKSGLLSAVLFSFIPCFGAYAIPLLVGGHDSFMLGNIIARELTITRNWPLASAMSMGLIVLTFMAILWLALSRRKDTQDTLFIGDQSV